ncbi:hypothetical protein CLU79DRAFT_590155 [Phycomyces nitens]|nr:hypothetical protein CLU79DRAFT_590155 [Phycomyces nitens]
MDSIGDNSLKTKQPKKKPSQAKQRPDKSRDRRKGKSKIIPGDDIYISDSEDYSTGEDTTLDRTFYASDNSKTLMGRLHYNKRSVRDDYIANSKVTPQDIAMMKKYSNSYDPAEQRGTKDDQDTDFSDVDIVDIDAMDCTPIDLVNKANGSDDESVYFDAPEMIDLTQSSDEETPQNDKEASDYKLDQRTVQKNNPPQTPVRTLNKINNFIKAFAAHPTSREFSLTPKLSPYIKHIRLLGRFYEIELRTTGSFESGNIILVKSRKTFMPSSQEHIDIFIQTALKDIPAGENDIPIVPQRKRPLRRSFGDRPVGFAPRKSQRLSDHNPETRHVGPSVGSNAAAIKETNKGHRMLEMMGWSQGDSIGPTNEGIKAPVQAFIRRKNIGLGL